MAEKKIIFLPKKLIQINLSGFLQSSENHQNLNTN